MNRFPLKEIARLIPAAVRNWQNDKAPRLGAALAYYMALSLAPTIVIMLAMAGWAFGAKAATGRNKAGAAFAHRSAGPGPMARPAMRQDIRCQR